MLNMPSILIFHKLFLPLIDDLQYQGRDMAFLPKVSHGGEEGLEVEYDSAGEW